jgi:hypothetical protein
MLAKIESNILLIGRKVSIVETTAYEASSHRTLHRTTMHGVEAFQ